MKHFNHRRRNLFSGPHLLGTLLIFAGVFALLSPTFLESQASLEKTLAVGVVCLMLGLIFVSTYGGTLIDIHDKKVKDYISFGNYKFGNWTTLPAIAKIKVISIQHKSTNTPNGISPTLSGKVTEFKTLVLSENQLPEFSFIYTNKDRAIKEAKRLASGLKVTLELMLSDK